MNSCQSTSCLESTRVTLVFKVANQFPYQLGVKYARQLKFSLERHRVSGKWSCQKVEFRAVKMNLNKLSSNASVESYLLLCNEWFIRINEQRHIISKWKQHIHMGYGWKFSMVQCWWYWRKNDSCNAPWVNIIIITIRTVLNASSRDNE